MSHKPEEYTQPPEEISTEMDDWEVELMLNHMESHVPLMSLWCCRRLQRMEQDETTAQEVMQELHFIMDNDPECHEVLMNYFESL